MGKVNEMLTGMLIPEMAIIVYKSNNFYGNDKYYLESRTIVGGKMGVGAPLTKSCISNIMDSFSANQDGIIHGKIPENMLFADSRKGHERYVWFRKPEKRYLYFSDKLEIPNGEMWVPGLIYVVDGKELSLYAFTGIDPKEKLFRAPFLNIYPNQKVCLGNAKVSKPKQLTYESIIRYWEEMFWKSEFSHLNGGNTIKGNLPTLIKRLIETEEKFPENELIALKTKISNLL